MARGIRPSEEIVQENIIKWNISVPDRDYAILIHCSTYNHELYIKDALEGFVMQKCNSPFCAIIIDDGSTDNTPNIIREYAEKYPDIIKPILLGENHMQHGLLRDPYFEKWHLSTKYMTQCEGDDYWTDPLKLQKQLDFIESHPECSICFHANNYLYPTGNMIVYRPNKIKKFYSVKDVILGGGEFMTTNTMFYRQDILNQEGKPDFWKNAPIGDGPCMMYFASKGEIGYIDDVMSVYRINSVGSWTSRQKSFESREQHYRKILKMYDEFDEYTHHKYHAVIMLKKMKNKVGFFKKWIINKVFK